MSLTHINQFTTNDPIGLGRQLSKLEDNVSAECDDIRANTLGLPVLASFTAVAGAVTNIVAIGSPKQLSVDSTAASVNVIFPKLTSANFGQRFTLLRRSSANNVVTACLDTTVLCNGSLTWPTFTGATPRLIEFYCDSSGYFYQ